MKRFEIHAERRNYGRSVAIDFLAASRVGDEPTHIAAPLTFVDLVEGAMIVEPTVHMIQDDAQQLMDALWVCGIRPTEGAGSAGAMAAAQAHLADMRTIALGALKKEGVL